MEYNLIKATKSDVERLINYKLETTINENMSPNEKAKITKYVESHVPKQFSSYNLITIENKVVGCLQIIKYGDGVLLDEIFIEKEFRNKGIGTSILTKILQDNNIVYLWVYKTNTIAKNLYLKLGFRTISTDGMRDFMQYKRKEYPKQ